MISVQDGQNQILRQLAEPTPPEVVAVTRARERVLAEDLLAPFDGLVTPEMLHTARSYVPVRTIGALPHRAFIPGAFPCDAYTLPAEQATIPAAKAAAHA